MSPNLLRRRGKLASAAKTARTVAIADAAWALARDRLAIRVPGVESRRGGQSRKVLLVGGAAAIVAAGALLNRYRARARLPGGSRDTYSPPGAPQPSNYDAPGPVANTSTPIPAPDPVVTPDPVDDSLAEAGAADPLAARAAAQDALSTGDAVIHDPLAAGPTPREDPPVSAPASVDEVAEEEAAAAEAGAIGGRHSDYAGREADLPASEAERPLAEAGEGEGEGEEQAEAGLVENVTPRDAGLTDAERQIEDTIEQAGRPAEGETPESLISSDATSKDDDDDGGSSEWQTWSGGAVKP
ncbi:MAG TPA: hypothetical protein VES79_00405 [Solirubrobacteraceae bacterium]|nr:hypothetical protein [Solirubrobacteraceae bacterium]